MFYRKFLLFFFNTTGSWHVFSVMVLWSRIPVDPVFGVYVFSQEKAYNSLGEPWIVDKQHVFLSRPNCMGLLYRAGPLHRTGFLYPVTWEAVSLRGLCIELEGSSSGKWTCLLFLSSLHVKTLDLFDTSSDLCKSQVWVSDSLTWLSELVDRLLPQVDGACSWFLFKL